MKHETKIYKTLKKTDLLLVYDMQIPKWIIFFEKTSMCPHQFIMLKFDITQNIPPDEIVPEDFNIAEVLYLYMSFCKK